MTTTRAQRRARREYLRKLQTADLSKSAHLFKKAPAFLKKDPQVAHFLKKCRAIALIHRQDPQVLSRTYAALPPMLRRDSDILRALLERGYDEPVVEQLKDPAAKWNRDLAKQLLSQRPQILKMASPAVRGDKTLVMLAVQQDASLLSCAPASIRRDTDVVRAAAAQWVDELQNTCQVRTLECGICGRDQLGPLQGYRCSNPGDRHFTCNECISRQVISMSKDSVGRLRRSKGRIFCPFHGTPGCKSGPIDDATLCRYHLCNAGFAALQAIKSRLVTQQVQWETQQVEKRKYESALLQQLAMSPDDRAIHVAYTYVVENILTLKCPRTTCRQAFVDFEGCFALRCSRCSVAFCAACLCDCDRDAHEHVRKCALMAEAGHPGSYFGPKEKFLDIQRARKTRLLCEYMSSIPDRSLRRGLYARLRPHLTELNKDKLSRVV